MEKILRSLDGRLLGPELVFTASRSSGPGGQNVNKVNSRVTLRFDVNRSAILTDEERAWLLTRLAGKLTDDGVLIITSGESRSQAANKAMAIEKFDLLLARALIKPRKRKKTKPSSSSVEKRIRSKKIKSEKKRWRRTDL